VIFLDAGVFPSRRLVLAAQPPEVVAVPLYPPAGSNPFDGLRAGSAGGLGVQMRTYVLMRILESAPSRYDTGLRILTRGRLDDAYERLTSGIEQGQRVLDLGCGTGALTLRAAQKEARVKGIDVNPQMLEIAEKRARAANLARNTELCEMGVAELGGGELRRCDERALLF